MIGQLRGTLLEKQAPELLVDVHGIVYEVNAPLSTFDHLPEIGKEIVLHIHFVVREDAQLLFGFYTKDERSLFRTLLKVNGVGPKLALTILSSATPEELVAAVMNHDTGKLIRLPGVGKKTAERLVIELRDSLKDWMHTQPIENNHAGSVTRRQVLEDAISALIALGFKQNEANRAVASIDNGLASSEELIRNALREMM